MTKPVIIGCPIHLEQRPGNQKFYLYGEGIEQDAAVVVVSIDDPTVRWEGEIRGNTAKVAKAHVEYVGKDANDTGGDLDVNITVTNPGGTPSDPLPTIIVRDAP